jgi:hypothetical protein
MNISIGFWPLTYVNTPTEVSRFSDIYLKSWVSTMSSLYLSPICMKSVFRCWCRLYVTVIIDLLIASKCFSIIFTLRESAPKFITWVRIPFRRGVLDATLCDKVCHWLTIRRWFSAGTPVSSTNKIDRHDITAILRRAY